MTVEPRPAPDAETAKHLPPGHPPVAPRRIGVLITNLGSPAASDTASVRRYLRQFLSDPRVIAEQFSPRSNRCDYTGFSYRYQR